MEKPKNKGGRPPIPQYIKFLRKYNSHDVEIILDKLMAMTEQKLEKYSQKSTLPMIEKLLIKAITAANNGSMTTLNLLLDRSIGPVPKGIDKPIKPKSGHLEFLEDIMGKEKEI